MARRTAIVFSDRLLEAALAAGDGKAGLAVVEALARSGLEDVRLAELARQIRENVL